MDGPAGLFKLLVLALLMSARIRASVAVAATRALFAAGWTTPRKMAASTWEQRTGTLNKSGYARYDERTSTMIADTTQLLLDDYGGDLRRLRAAARKDPVEERALLTRFKGVGDIGVDIFFRDAQRVWPELRPFADQRALTGAQQLGHGTSARDLAELVNGDDLPRLLSALVPIDLEGTADEIVPDYSRNSR